MVFKKSLLLPPPNELRRARLMIYHFLLMSSQENDAFYSPSEMSSPIHVPELNLATEEKGCLISINLQEQPKQIESYLSSFTIRPKRQVSLPKKPYVFKPFQSFFETENVVQQLHLIFSEKESQKHE